MTMTEFLLARIAEDEQRARDEGADAMMGARWKRYPEDAYNEIQALVLAHSRRTLTECEAKRRIVERHESWPVLVETQPTFEPVDNADPSSFAIRASRQMAWITEREYRNKFGDEPPTAPMIAMLAEVYADHPDYDDAWRP